MNMFLLNLLLAVIWGMATGLFTISNLTVGYLLSFAVLYCLKGVLGPSRYFGKVPLVIRFVVRYLWEMILANLRVAYDVLVPGALAIPKLPLGETDPFGPEPDITGSIRAPLASASVVCPGVVAIPLDARTDAEITMLANLITLTPGSVSLDLSPDKRTLYVHAMYIDGGDVEAYRRSVKEGLERRVLELLR
jgi:multicomponent Na+:H+ antiporter subunit E